MPPRRSTSGSPALSARLRSLARQILAISNDVGGGTAASPNLTYGTWSITAANTAFLQLDQSVTTGALGTVTGEGGVGGATALTLAGAGEIALGQADSGDWQLLQSIDASATTGTVIITGASAGPPGTNTNAFASAAQPGLAVRQRLWPPRRHRHRRRFRAHRSQARHRP